MILKWIAGLLLLGALAAHAQAEEKDAPLPFDEPSAAQPLAKKAPAAPAVVSKPTVARKLSRAKSGRTGKPVVKGSAKPVPKKIAPSKPLVQKPAAKVPVVSKKKKPR